MLLVNVKNKACIREGRKELPNYNAEGEAKALYCGEHKKEGLVALRMGQASTFTADRR